MALFWGKKCISKHDVIITGILDLHFTLTSGQYLQAEMYLWAWAVAPAAAAAAVRSEASPRSGHESLFQQPPSGTCLSVWQPPHPEVAGFPFSSQGVPVSSSPCHPAADENICRWGEKGVILPTYMFYCTLNYMNYAPLKWLRIRNQTNIILYRILKRKPT